MSVLNETIPKKETPTVQKSNWLDTEKETILLYGPAKGGKTWAYCSIIERKIKQGGKVYILNTDSGVSKTFKQYFGDKLDTVKNSVNYYYIGDMDDAKKAVLELISKINENDLIIFDLISDIWSISQRKFIDDVSGNDPINYIVKASKDPKKFGMFEGSMWSYITAAHDFVVNPFISAIKCDVVGVCSEKELNIEKAFGGGKSKNVEYESAGAKPAGQPRLAYQFNTIVYLNKLNSGEKHYFQIMGDRGATTNQGMISFDKNFIEKFEEERKKRYVK